MFNSVLDFEREISSNFKSKLNKTFLFILDLQLEIQTGSSEFSKEFLERYNTLQNQFKVKSSFLSGYQLKQLRDVLINF